MSEYNQRQYRLMLDRLNAFERGRIPIDNLVVDLEGLVNSLEATEPSWKQTFLHEWGTLEDARAVTLFRNAKTFDEETIKIVLAAAAQLKLLVLEKIDDLADHPQDIDWTKQ